MIIARVVNVHEYVYCEEVYTFKSMQLSSDPHFTCPSFDLSCASTGNSSEVSKAKLNCGTSANTSVLENVVEVDLVYGILGGVNQLQVILESGLEDHGRGVSGL